MPTRSTSAAVFSSTRATRRVPGICVTARSKRSRFRERSGVTRCTHTTRNHFALDVGVDRRDVAGALDAFTGGVERRIDAAEVNGRMFLNNVSLGIYGDAVRSPAYRDAKVRTHPTTATRHHGRNAAPENSNRSRAAPE
jgi:hypothetical protein